MVPCGVTQCRCRRPGTPKKEAVYVVNNSSSYSFVETKFYQRDTYDVEAFSGQKGSSRCRAAPARAVASPSSRGSGRAPRESGTLATPSGAARV